MPTYSGSHVLQNDEWLLLQIKEGPCNAGCDYCYENAHIRKVIATAQSAGIVEESPLLELTTRELARLTEKHREQIPTEMSLQEIEVIFRILHEAKIGRVGLIGSEPSSHRNFTSILDTALANKLKVLVYTAGLALKKLEHDAVTFIVLHIDYGRIDEEERNRRINLGTLPSKAYMKDVVGLLEKGKEIHLRTNFSSTRLEEEAFVSNFFAQVPVELRSQTRLKYSFNTRVNDDSAVHYETPDTLRSGARMIQQFVDRFRCKFPEVDMLAERPLFPCSFDLATWTKYADVGGFLSSCDMEYTFYPKSGLALCPPSRDLVAAEPILSAAALTTRLAELRRFLEETYRIPSFDCCTDCQLREDLTCQGGCLGYKAGREARNSDSAALPASTDAPCSAAAC